MGDARLLTKVDSAEALEMAASRAKVVHPRCIRAAAATHTPVVIRDLNRLDVTGTRIALSRLQGVMQFFEKRALLMVSQSVNDLCLSLLIDFGDHELLLKNAHAALIPTIEEKQSTEGVFGKSWQQIQYDH